MREIGKGLEGDRYMYVGDQFSRVRHYEYK